MALENIIFNKFMEAKDHWGVASLDPSGMVGRIYVGDLSPLDIATHV